MPGLPADPLAAFAPPDGGGFDGASEPLAFATPEALPYPAESAAPAPLPPEVLAALAAGASSGFGSAMPGMGASPLAGAASANAAGASAAGGGTEIAHGANPAQTNEQLEELAKKLYDKIRDRLRAELRLDRERRGRITDLAR